MGIEGDLIGKNGYGIPSDVFESRRYYKRGLVCGSGQTLDINISPDLIEIDTPSKNEEIFFFCLTRKERILYPEIFTRRCDKNFPRNAQPEHPDLFAWKLLQASFDYYRREKIEIDLISVEWWGPGAGIIHSDMYTEFIMNLQKDMSASLTDQILAAKKTWNGEKFALLGYPEIPPESFKWRQTPGDELVTFFFAKSAELNPVNMFF